MKVQLSFFLVVSFFFSAIAKKGRSIDSPEELVALLSKECSFIDDFRNPRVGLYSENFFPEVTTAFFFEYESGSTNFRAYYSCNEIDTDDLVGNSSSSSFCVETSSDGICTQGSEGNGEYVFIPTESGVYQDGSLAGVCCFLG